MLMNDEQKGATGVAFVVCAALCRRIDRLIPNRGRFMQARGDTRAARRGIEKHLTTSAATPLRVFLVFLCVLLHCTEMCFVDARGCVVLLNMTSFRREAIPLSSIW